MLLLEFKSREGDVIDFKVGDKQHFYKYTLTQSSDYMILLTIERIREQGGQWSSTFQCAMPTSKKQLHRQIGGWLYNQIHYDKEILQGTGDHKVYMDYTLTAEYRKYKQFCYLRSKRMSDVIGGLAWKSFLVKYEVEKTLIDRICNISWRLTHSTHKGDMTTPEIFRCHSRMSTYMQKIFLSDLEKYNVSFAKHILCSVRDNSQFMFPEGYKELIINTPAIIKKNNYGLMFPIEKIEPVLGNYIPQNRWQYFASRSACTNWEEYRFEYAGGEVIKQFLLKMPKSDISLWHYFKKYNHIKGPYSTKQIKHILQLIMDGDRIYNQLKDNAGCIAFVPIEGSCMRMLRNAIYNHRQEQELTKKRRLSGRNFPQPLPPFKLPDELEAIRMKTEHDMIQAGIECQHCIGSYAGSSDMFFREGNICAQVRRNDLEIQQCYDVRDQITKASEAFRAKLRKAFKPYKELVNA